MLPDTNRDEHWRTASSNFTCYSICNSLRWIFSLHCQFVDYFLYAAWFDLQVETGDLVCAFMQADSSCEMFARLPKGQERDGWIWRLHSAMNGMRTASRDFTEYGQSTWVPKAANWSDVCLCKSRTKHVWCLM